MPPTWTPTAGQLALYRGRTKADTRNVVVVAEAVRGYFLVEAVGKNGRNVRLTVRGTSLVEPQPDLFV